MVRDLLKLWSPRVDTPEGLRQAGALPYAIVEGRVAFLLITSRRNGRWMFPKGVIEPGMTPWESAAQEAFEEAGVSGEIATRPIGSYRGSAGADESVLVDIDIYPLRVETQHETYREMGQRLRHWVVLSEAKRLLSDPTLARLAVNLHEQLVG
ncbi:NUDIX hydrolase [Devosia sp.]|uniref:NUDIX hydrolase n=1 Tax=Devosia sp. TaxID=1871048 RepID=UPI002AFE9B94|nr:NUDIX hydrolase [Devosia sp.]